TLVTVGGEVQSTQELFEYSHELQISHEGRLRIPVKGWGSIKLNGIGHLRELLPESVRLKWKDLTFAEAFPELNEITNDRQAAPFAVWERALKEELERAGEPLEAFGLKVPTQTISLWGTLLIGGVQLYFLIHMMALSRKLEPNDLGW